jgi:anti-sigma factor ChrR (cupin superfamily)
MTAATPLAANHAGLAALDSRYVDVGAIPWEETRFPGIQVKRLLEDKASGLLTTLVKMAPGARLPEHEHVEIEQTWVLQGSLADEEGECTVGNFVWRPAGNRHSAHAPGGALLLSVFLKPNKFFDSEDAPRGFDRDEAR